MPATKASSCFRSAVETVARLAPAAVAACDSAVEQTIPWTSPTESAPTCSEYFPAPAPATTTAFRMRMLGGAAFGGLTTTTFFRPTFVVPRTRSATPVAAGVPSASFDAVTATRNADVSGAPAGGVQSKPTTALLPGPSSATFCAGAIGCQGDAAAGAFAGKPFQKPAGRSEKPTVA